MNPANRVPGTIDSFYLVQIEKRRIFAQQLVQQRQQQRRERVQKWRERIRAAMKLR